MVSLETCKKLKEEIISLIGGNLLEEDELFLNSLSNSTDSKSVLGLATDLKEYGNSLFKKGKIDNALDKYGSAAMILASYQFEGEYHRCEFFKLALSILMNSTICFSKRKEFVQVDQVCSIVLDFDPYNVKAMYRRALAAIELRKRDWAKFDLRMAAEIDPNNKEVLKKLEEIKDNVHKRNSVECSQGDIPVGLGIGLSFSKKKESEDLGKGELQKRHESQVNESGSCEYEKEQHVSVKEYGTAHSSSEQKQKEKFKEKVMECQEMKVQEHGMGMSNNTESLEVHSEVQSEVHSCVTFAQDQGGSAVSHSCPSLKTIMEAGKEKFQEEEIKEEIMENMLPNEEQGDMLSSVCTEQEKETLNHAKPRYRFQNRRRQDSLLTLSKEDYLMISQGKTLKCYNAKLGSYMEVRKANKLAGTSSNGNGFHKQQEICSLQGENQSTNNKEQQCSIDSMEMHSCVTSEGDEDRNMEDNSCSNVDDECSSQAAKHIEFKFSAEPKLTAQAERNQLKRTTQKSPPTTVKMNKKRKTLMPCRSICLPTNIINVKGSEKDIPLVYIGHSIVLVVLHLVLKFLSLVLII